LSLGQGSRQFCPDLSPGAGQQLARKHGRHDRSRHHRLCRSLGDDSHIGHRAACASVLLRQAGSEKPQGGKVFPALLRTVRVLLAKRRLRLRVGRPGTDRLLYRSLLVGGRD